VQHNDFEAGRTGLEPATSGVTGRRYNQLNYRNGSPCNVCGGVVDGARVQHTKAPQQLTLIATLTVADMVRAYMSALVQRVEAGDRSTHTRVAYEKALRIGAMRHFSAVEADRVTPRQVAQMRAEIAETRGPSIAAQAVKVLGMAYRHAQREGLLDVDIDPTRHVRRRQPARDRRRPLTADASRRVVEHCLDALSGRPAVVSPILGAYFVVVLGCGLRRTEAARLRVEDWSTAPRLLTVRGRKNARRDGPLVVPAAPLVAEVLDAVVEAAWHPVWCFPSPRSASGHLEDPGRAWGRLCASCDVPAGTRIHDLRHTFAAAVYATTGDLKAVQRLLGHSSVAISSRYVGHTSPSVVEPAAHGAVAHIVGVDAGRLRRPFSVSAARSGPTSGDTIEGVE